MSIIRYNFSTNEQITAQIADEATNHLWTAYAQNSSGICYLKKQSGSNPYQTYYSLSRYVDEITALATDDNYIFVAYDDVTLLGEILSKSNPLTVSTQILRGAITEAPIDVIVSDGYVFYLIPGNNSGTHAKLLKYDTSGVLQNTIELTTIMNARSMVSKYVAFDGLESDTYTNLLLNCNDTVDTNNFTDSSPNDYAITPYGQVVIDDAQSVFGGLSGKFDGNGDYLSVVDSADWDFGSGDWTIDFRVRFASVAGSQGFLGRETSGSSYFYIAKEGNSLRIRDYPGTLNITLAWTPVIDRWYHIAIIRNGNDVKAFIDGTQLGSTFNFTGSMNDRSVPLFIGTSFSTSYWLYAWLDEFRVSKGIARWTSDFLLPQSIRSDIWMVNYEDPVKLVRVYEPFTNVYGYESTDIV